MSTQEVVSARILELCHSHGLTVNGLALASGVAQQTINSIIHLQSQNTGVVTIKKICDALGITLAEFFNTDDFNSLEQELR